MNFPQSYDIVPKNQQNNGKKLPTAPLLFHLKLRIVDLMNIVVG